MKVFKVSITVHGEHQLVYVDRCHEFVSYQYGRPNCYWFQFLFRLSTLMVLHQARLGKVSKTFADVCSGVFHRMAAFLVA